MGFPSAQVAARENCGVTETHPHPDLPLEGEGEGRSRIVVGRRRTIVLIELARQLQRGGVAVACGQRLEVDRRSEEHTSELQSLMRISYAVFCLKKQEKITSSPSTPTIY